MQPGHGASELNVPLGQPVVGSEGGGKRSENYSLKCTGKGYRSDKEQRGNTRCACCQCSLFLEHQQTRNPLFHPYWFVKCQCLCPCQVLPINNSVTQPHHVPKKGRLSYTGPKPRRDHFNWRKSTYYVNNQLLLTADTLRRKKGESPPAVLLDQSQYRVPAVPDLCSECPWDKSKKPRDVAAQFARTWPKPGLVSRPGTASDITHITLRKSLALHLSQFFHLWNRTW